MIPNESISSQAFPISISLRDDWGRTGVRFADTSQSCSLTSSLNESSLAGRVAILLLNKSRNSKQRSFVAITWSSVPTKVNSSRNLSDPLLSGGKSGLVPRRKGPKYRFSHRQSHRYWLWQHLASGQKCHVFRRLRNPGVGGMLFSPSSGGVSPSRVSSGWTIPPWTARPLSQLASGVANSNNARQDPVAHESHEWPQIVSLSTSVVGCPKSLRVSEVWESCVTTDCPSIGFIFQ